MDVPNLRINGRLGKDPEIKVTKKGVPFCFFSVCYSPNKGVRGIWFNFVAWAEMAEEICGRYKKGDVIYITDAGSVAPSDFTGRDGKEYKSEQWTVYGIGEPGGEEVTHGSVRDQENWDGSTGGDDDLPY